MYVETFAKKQIARLPIVFGNVPLLNNSKGIKYNVKHIIHKMKLTRIVKYVGVVQIKIVGLDKPGMINLLYNFHIRLF